MLWRKSLPSTASRTANCKGDLFPPPRRSLCCSVRKRVTQLAQSSFQYPKLPTRPHGSLFLSVLAFPSLSCFNSLWWAHWFYFVSFRRSSSWATTTEMIGDACVSVFTMPYPMSDIGSIHAGIHLLKRCVHTGRREFLLTKDCVTTRCRNDRSPPTIFSPWNTYNHVRGQVK